MNGGPWIPGVEDIEPEPCDYDPPNDGGSETEEGQIDPGYLRREVRRLRTQRAAREIVARDNKPDPQPFDAGTLTELLSRAPEPVARVEGLIPWAASILLVAMRKTGKTTLILCLARCLITGELFLGRLTVRPIAQGAKVAILNYEVSTAQLARWAHEVGVPPDRLVIVNLRGRRNPLLDPEDRARLAEWLRSHNVETLIVDPFGRAYGGESQNDAGQVQAWLVQLDEFARTEVGALDVVLTAHAGWNGERTRGSSALEDWADAIVKLTHNEQDGDTGPRYISAVGRDIELEEDRLSFDPATRWLSLSGGGSRKLAAAAARLDEMVEHVVGIVTASPGANGTDVEKQLKAAGVPAQKGDGRSALAAAVERGLLRQEPGSRGAKHYYVADVPRPTPTYPDGARLTYPDPTYIGGVGHGVPEGSTYPEGSVLTEDSDEPSHPSAHHCCDCGQPIPGGFVRCQPCRRRAGL